MRVDVLFSHNVRAAALPEPDFARGPKLDSFFGLYRATVSGELLDANLEFARLCGFADVASMLAAGLSLERDFHVEADRRAAFMRELTTSGVVRAFESRIRRCDGSAIWISENAIGSRDARGEIVFVEGTVEDITARKEREGHRHDSEEKLRTLIGSVEDSLWSVDSEYRLITFNAPFIRRFVELTGYVLKAGDRVTDLIPEDWREEEIAFYQRALAGERFVVEQRYMSYIGERFYELSFNPIYGTDGVTGVAVISKDSTERHRTQLELKMAKSAAESANRLKSEFLANMSHEIRTPMNGIMGMTDLLLRTPLAVDQQEIVNTVRVSGESLLTVINDILDFSKIEAGKLQFEHIDFDLGEVVDSALDLFSAPALAKQLELGALARPDVPNALRGDPSRLRQVINNLFSNAIKFTEAGEIVLTIAKVKQQRDRVVLEFQLRDTGIGIDPQAQDRLFEAFSQADGSTTRKYGGTGLGLVISKRLVALMNGSIRVDSFPGKGSVFSFTAEFEVIEGNPVPPSPERRPVLVVSENTTSRFLLGEYLTGCKIPHRFARDNEVARGLMVIAGQAGEPFETVIVDLPLSAEKIAALVAEAPATRILALTLLGQSREGLNSIRGVQILAKPIKQARLLSALETAASPVEDANDSGSLPVPGSSIPDEEKKPAELRILLAEDNTVNQKVALGLLRQLGYSATVAANGEQVLSALNASPYDLILMDCQMPVMDGFEATRTIRAQDGPQPIIIAMTANALPGDRERCLVAGMDDYITKPIRAAILGEKIAKLTSDS